MITRTQRLAPFAFLLLALVPVLASCGRERHERRRIPVVHVGPRDNLRWIVDTLRGPATVQLADGDYDLEPTAFTDSSCGNCRDSAEMVPATRGLLVRGRGIRLVGASSARVVIHTHAGYGVLFDGCAGCELRNVTVTDGARDRDGRATDAGVVVRDGEVTLQDCVVRDNIGDSAVVDSVIVGVAGVVVREGGLAIVQNCRIERNSWDGISLYRSARGRIFDNVIDGVDEAHGHHVGGGRGVGIGLTWDARALVEGNLVTRYWKGIGVFMNAQADVRENIVENVLTWGLAYWGADGGRPVAVMESNAVFETGACGVIVDRADSTPAPVDPAPRRGPLQHLAEADPGRLVGNLFVRTDQNPAYDSGQPYCTQRPIAREHVPPHFTISGNLLHAVRQPGRAPVEDTLGAAAFRAAADSTLQELASHPMLTGSRFLGAFGGEGS